MPTSVFASEAENYSSPDGLSGGEPNYSWDGYQVLFEGKNARDVASLQETQHSNYTWVAQMSPGGPLYTGAWATYVINGQTAFCVEPTNGHTLDGSQYTSSLTWGGLAPWQQYRIEQIMGYGYPNIVGNGGVEASMATQIMIWEVAFGYLDNNMNYNWTGLRDYFCGRWSGVKNAYDHIKSRIATHSIIPSYAGTDPATAPTYEMPWSGSVTLQDTNNVTNQFAPTTNNGNLGLGITTGSFTVTTSNPANSAGTVKLSKTTPIKGLVFWRSGAEQVKATATGANEVIEAYFHIRAPKAGNLTIEKYDTVTNSLLPGARIQLKQGGTVVADVTTGADGKAPINNIPPGNYEVVEIVAPNGYFLNSTPIPITITEGGNHTVRLGNIPHSEIRIVKTDSVTGGALDGITFNIKRSDGTNIGNFTTTGGGKINVGGLQSGTYIITEIATLPSHVLDTTPKTVTISAGQVATVDISNVPYPKLELQKVSAQTGLPVADVTFTIMFADGTPIGDFTTDVNGKIYIQNNSTFVAGDYKVQEIDVPEWIVLDDTIRDITLEWGKTTSITVENNEFPKLELEKVSAQTGLSIADVTFRLFESDGITEIGDFITDADGKIEWENTLLAGDYKIQEIDVPEWIVLDETVRNITLEWGETTSIVVENNEYPWIEIEKKSIETGAPVQGVTFRIMHDDADQTEIDRYTTDADGKILVENTLLAGDYLVQEVETPAHIHLDDTIRQTTLNWGRGSFEPFENHEYPTLEIIKIDEQDNDILLKGFHFRIYKADGVTVVGDGVTDENGRILVENKLEAGKYFIQETAVPAPIKYVLDDTKHEVTLYWRETTSITLQNTRTATLELFKYDIEDKTPLEGVKFELYSPTDELLGEFVTDKDGFIQFSTTLPPVDDYYVIETETTDRHILNSDRIDVTLKPGETTTLKVDNPRQKGTIELYKVAAHPNPLTGDKKGDKLAGAVFTMRNDKGEVVETLVTDENGYAKSGLHDIGVYTVEEVNAPAYYHINMNIIQVKLKHHQDNVCVTFEDIPVIIETEVVKKGKKEVKPSESFEYTFSGIENKSTVPLEMFMWWDELPYEAVRLEEINTGVWSNAQLSLDVYVITNKDKNYRKIAENLSSVKNNKIDCSPEKLKLDEDEYVIEFKVMFGTVESKFHATTNPTIKVKVLDDIQECMKFINKTGVGGKYLDRVARDYDEFETLVKCPPKTEYTLPRPKLPKTGF